ncbi:MAG: glycosyltransferase [Rhodospirillales bacterium]
MSRLPFTSSPSPGGILLDAPLPPRAAGAWCSLRLSTPDDGAWWAKLELTDAARGQVVREFFLGPASRRGGRNERATLVHVPSEAIGLRLRIFTDAVPAFELHVRVLRRWQAAMSLLWHGRRLLPLALAGAPAGAAGRIRTLLGQAPARAGEPPPYKAWITWFEPPAPPPPDFDVQVAVVSEGPALAATLASIAAQTQPSAHPSLRVLAPRDWQAVRAKWVVVLAPGELLSPHALAWLAHAAHACPTAAGLTADCDSLLSDGSRADPLFKPTPDRLLLRSGFALIGAGAFRWPAEPPELPVRADAARQVLAQLHAEAVAHIPRILTHVTPGATPPPHEAPRLRRTGSFTPSVTALVPSAARKRHVVRCLRRVLETNSYNNFVVTLALAAPDAADPRILRALKSLPRLRLLPLAIAPFNYPAVNNAAARVTDSDLLLLLNDDVAPLLAKAGNADWLDAMVAHMQSPEVGAVGARLLYGNEMVQHEGVIMGLANLCENAGRLRPGTDPGPHGLARQAREVSAATAACLLIRTDLYRQLGGMDEGFAIALNDVDLCLRVRQSGHSIVFCPEATLYHYESLSLGRHYAGARAGLESLEVRRLRARWADVIAADPFYNPQASLEPGREWQPAFPPRDGEIVRMATNPLAAH